MDPTGALKEISHQYPEAWHQVEKFFSLRGNDLPNWPRWCFLPMAGWYAIVSEAYGGGRLSLERVGDVASLAALGTWRYSQGVYRLHPALLAALLDTQLSSELPAEVLTRLPEWCVYIETPSQTYFNEPLAGFWAHLEWDANTSRRELRLLLNLSQGLFALPIHLGDWSLTEGIERMFREGEFQATIAQIDPRIPPDAIGPLSTKLKTQIESLIALLLYLCSEEPEISDLREPGTRPGYAHQKKTKDGLRLFPAAGPRIWSVGDEIGSAIARARDEISDREGPSPHLRRAHWHGYWIGAGREKFVYKWLSPIFVGQPKEKEETEQSE